VATVRRDSGIVTSLVDRRAGRELVGFGMRRGSDYFDTARADLGLGVYQLVEEDAERHIGMSGWHLDEVRSERSLLRGATVEVIEDGPVRCTLRFVHQVDDSSITTDLTMYRELARIDYRAGIAWRERATAERIPNLKVSFCAELDGAQAWFETPCSAARRPAGGLEVPALRWAAVGGDGLSLALLNDGRSGHDALGTRLRLTLARSATSPDVTSGPGDYSTRFALLPLPDGIDAAAVTREAAGFNQPLIARAPSTGNGARAALPFRPALRGSDSVLITAVKNARDGRGRVLRLVEMHGRDATVRITGIPHHATAWDCDLTEQRTAPCARLDGDVVLHLRPHQVSTVLVDEAGA
jgi:alpha-mannosidase